MNKPSLSEVRALVGNPEVYAVQKEDGSWYPVREPLDDAVLRQHRKGERTIGTYIVTDSRAHTLVFDIDSDPEPTLNRLCKLLNELGLGYLVEDSGRKGFHVWVPVEEPVEAELLYRLGRGVREEAGFPDMEVFPKQTETRDLGNLVKLPGGVHRVTGNNNDFIGPTSAEDAENTVEFIEMLSGKYPEVGVRSRVGGTEASIEYPCVNYIQEGVHEGGRNIHLFHLAVMLRRFSLSDANVEHIVRRANGLGDPLDDIEVDGILENSRYSGPICGQLDSAAHCGEQCILAKHSGLYTRAGALKWAQDGENVVVTVQARTDDGKLVELEHPDLDQGRVILLDPKPRRNDGD